VFGIVNSSSGSGGFFGVCSPNKAANADGWLSLPWPSYKEHSLSPPPIGRLWVACTINASLLQGCRQNNTKTPCQSTPVLLSPILFSFMDLCE
jgi:hypothetical protein